MAYELVLIDKHGNEIEGGLFPDQESAVEAGEAWAGGGGYLAFWVEDEVKPDEA